MQIRGLLERHSYGPATTEEVSFLLARIDKLEAEVEQLRTVAEAATAVWDNGPWTLTLGCNVWRQLSDALDALAQPQDHPLAAPEEDS